MTTNHGTARLFISQPEVWLPSGRSGIGKDYTYLGLSDDETWSFIDIWEDCFPLVDGDIMFGLRDLVIAVLGLPELDCDSSFPYGSYRYR
jgi:hypothetical protein